MTRGDALVELHGNIITVAMLVGLVALVVVVCVVEYRTELRSEHRRAGTPMRLFLTHTPEVYPVGHEVTRRGHHYRVTSVQHLTPTVLLDGSHQPCAQVWGVPL